MGIQANVCPEKPKRNIRFEIQTWKVNRPIGKNLIWKIVFKNLKRCCLFHWVRQKVFSPTLINLKKIVLKNWKQRTQQAALSIPRSGDSNLKPAKKNQINPKLIWYFNQTVADLIKPIFPNKIPQGNSFTETQFHQSFARIFLKDSSYRRNLSWFAVFQGAIYSG